MGDLTGVGEECLGAFPIGGEAAGGFQGRDGFHGSAGFTQNAAERVRVGTVPSLPLFAQFDDYKAFALDVGYRQYLTGGRIRPFIGSVFGSPGSTPSR